MDKRSLGNIAVAVRGKLIPDDSADSSVESVSVDTRTLNSGSLFFALKAKRNGHEFIDEANKKGASAVVVSEDIESNIPKIRVDDTLVALGDLARDYRNQLEIPVIIITGSMGKTTTREALSFTLSGKLNVASSARNFNNLIGLPLSILNISRYHDIAVLEAGINQPDEMDRLGEISTPNHAVILNIAPVHLEGLDSLDKIAREKLKLLKYLTRDGIAYLNADDKFLTKQKIIPSKKVVSFGFDDEAQFHISNFKFGSEGAPVFMVNGRKIRMRIPGRAAAYYAASVWSVAAQFGISESEIIDRLEDFPGVSNRMQFEQINGIKLIVDVYNSSPLAVQAALEVLSNMQEKRKIAALADMLELGEQAKDYHQQMGEQVHKYGINKLFLFGNLSGDAAKEAISLGMPEDDVFWTEILRI